MTKRYDEEEAHKLLDEKLEFVSDYMRNNHGAVEQYGIYLIPEFMLGYDDIEIVIVAASENERATVVFSDIPVVKRGREMKNKYSKKQLEELYNCRDFQRYWF